jgi:hypothetical protein
VKNGPRKKVGRPSGFTQATADEICRRLAEGESLRSICRDAQMPNRQTVFDWLDARPEFAGQYARARQRQFELWGDDILDIADDGSNDFLDRVNRSGVVQRVFNREHVERSRLRVDSRKWLLSKLLPKKYGRLGERLDARQGSDDASPETKRELIDAILALVQPKADPPSPAKPEDGRCP